MDRAARTAVATVATLAALLALPAPGAEAASRGRLKVCAYNHDRDVQVEVDGAGFARFPRDGTCETESVRAGSHRISTAENSGFTSGQVIRSGKRSTFYTLPVSVRVSPGDQTRVNLYFF